MRTILFQYKASDPGLITLHSNTTSLCVEQTSPHADVSTSKPSDPLFEFFPGRLDHWVGTEMGAETGGTLGINTLSGPGGSTSSPR